MIVVPSPEQEFLKKMGLKIKGLRNEKHISLNDLANQFGFEKASISRLEAGKTNATTLTLFRLSEALSVPVSWFFVE